MGQQLNIGKIDLFKIPFTNKTLHSVKSFRKPHKIKVKIQFDSIFYKYFKLSIQTYFDKGKFCEYLRPIFYLFNLWDILLGKYENLQNQDN